MQKYNISKNDADQRLDKFLKKLLINASLSTIYKFNRKGKIKVITLDGKKTKQDNEYKIQEGEIIHVFLSDSEIQEFSQKKEQKSSLSSQNMLQKKDITFEDEDILVINKNPGMNVHPGDHKTKEVSLIEQVEDYYKGKLNSLTFKPSLIHRIDRDTSWIIMIAKSKKTLVQLASDFKSHKKIQKTYFCVTLWKLSRREGTITKKLKRIENAKNENKVQISDTWLEAITHFKLIDEYKLKLPLGEQTISILKVTIETGRMHQIRVHLATLWNPILWDKIYGNKKLNAYFEKYFHIQRQMLHAWKIEFFHPGKKKKMKLEAKLKDDMMNFISILRK